MTNKKSSLSEVAGGARSAMFLGLDVAWRLIDTLVAKGILTKGEAKASFYSIADSIRNDAGGTTSEASTETLARWLEEAGDRFKA
jgi:polyhydroxyalkanoate synthesis regulator phasin